jgi:hypothetical protein
MQQNNFTGGHGAAQAIGKYANGQVLNRTQGNSTGSQEIVYTAS